MEQLKLSTTVSTGQQSLDAARKSEDTSWPSTHYLEPLHPVLDWASDRALASISRNEVLVICGDVDEPAYLMLGTISNRRGQLLKLFLRRYSKVFGETVKACEMRHWSWHDLQRILAQGLTLMTLWSSLGSAVLNSKRRSTRAFIPSDLIR